MLASTYNGDSHELNRIVMDQYLNDYVRGAAMTAHLILYKHEIISREQLVQILQQWFTKFVHDYSQVPSMLVDCCCTVRATELAIEIENYYTKGLVRSSYISKDRIKEQFGLPQSQALKHFYERHCYNYIETCMRSMGRLFKNYDDEKLCDEDEISFAENGEKKHYDDCNGQCYPGCTEYCSGQSIKPAEKISRNALCPCGSGKKYKKCCGDELPF